MMRNNDFVAFPMQAAERLLCPVCDEAMCRLQRLQMIDMDGHVNDEGIKALCVTLHSTLYDNLLEADEDVVEIHHNLQTLFYDDQIAGMYFYLCLLYGMIGEVIPEQLQWIATNELALLQYCETAIILQCQYMIDDGVIDESTGTEADGDSNKSILQFPSS